MSKKMSTWRSQIHARLEYGKGVSSYLLLVVQTLVVVLEDGHAFGLAAVVLGVCVGHVAREDFLPEGEAARGACERGLAGALLCFIWSVRVVGRIGGESGAEERWCRAAVWSARMRSSSSI